MSFCGQGSRRFVQSVSVDGVREKGVSGGGVGVGGDGGSIKRGAYHACASQAVRRLGHCRLHGAEGLFEWNAPTPSTTSHHNTPSDAICRLIHG
jgi:hypothetical protein